ncbi:MAG: hypothetical protein F7C35_04290 [Desulfurococcales archaeon]|nr:hypothetical protein [Desulfurococcales archaeon]
MRDRLHQFENWLRTVMGSEGATGQARPLPPNIEFLPGHHARLQRLLYILRGSLLGGSVFRVGEYVIAVDNERSARTLDRLIRYCLVALRIIFNTWEEHPQTGETPTLSRVSIHDLFDVVLGGFVVGYDYDARKYFVMPISTVTSSLLLNYLKCGGKSEKAVRKILGFDLHRWEYPTRLEGPARIRLQGDLTLWVLELEDSMRETAKAVELYEAYQIITQTLNDNVARAVYMVIKDSGVPSEDSLATLVSKAAAETVLSLIDPDLATPDNVKELLKSVHAEADIGIVEGKVDRQSRPGTVHVDIKLDIGNAEEVGALLHVKPPRALHDMVINTLSRRGERQHQVENPLRTSERILSHQVLEQALHGELNPEIVLEAASTTPILPRFYTPREIRDGDWDVWIHIEAGALIKNTAGTILEAYMRKWPDPIMEPEPKGHEVLIQDSHTLRLRGIDLTGTKFFRDLDMKIRSDAFWNSIEETLKSKDLRRELCKEEVLEAVGMIFNWKTGKASYIAEGQITAKHHEHGETRLNLKKPTLVIVDLLNSYH